MPLTTPVTVVDSVIAGVVVEVATVPAKPLADTTDTSVTEPPPPPPPVAAIVWLGQVPEMVTFVPATKLGVVVPVPPFATGRVPVTPVESGRPVKFVAVPLEGVPNAPPGAT